MIMKYLIKIWGEMNVKTIKLTSKEIRALNEVLYCNPCRSGCAYDEMSHSGKTCDECEFTKSIESIEEKINN